MACDNVRPALEAYALGALDPEEAASVERHLGECPNCRLALEELAETVDALPQALAAASPLRIDSSAKERLMRSIEAAVSNSRRLTRLLPSASPWKPLGGLLKPRNLGMATGLLLLVVLVVFITWSVHLGAVVAQERALRGQFAELVGQQELVLEIVDSRNTVRRLLLPPIGASSGSPYGKLYSRTDMGHVVAMAGRLPPPPPDQAYHLWLRTSDRLQLAGVMQVNDDGFGLLVLEADVAGPVYESAFLTLQPLNNTSPSENVVLRWEATP